VRALNSHTFPTPVLPGSGSKGRTRFMGASQPGCPSSPGAV